MKNREYQVSEHQMNLVYIGKYWKKHFLKDPLYFRIYADFEADNGTDNFDIVDKTTKLYNQNPYM